MNKPNHAELAALAGYLERIEAELTAAKALLQEMRRDLANRPTTTTAPGLSIAALMAQPMPQKTQKAPLASCYCGAQLHACPVCGTAGEVHDGEDCLGGACDVCAARRYDLDIDRQLVRARRYDLAPLTTLTRPPDPDALRYGGGPNYAPPSWPDTLPPITGAAEYPYNPNDPSLGGEE